MICTFSNIDVMYVIGTGQLDKRKDVFLVKLFIVARFSYIFRNIALVELCSNLYRLSFHVSLFNSLTTSNCIFSISKVATLPIQHGNMWESRARGGETDCIKFT